MQVSHIVYSQEDIYSHTVNEINSNLPSYLADLIIGTLSMYVDVELFADAVYTLHNSFNAITNKDSYEHIIEQGLSIVITNEMDSFDTNLSYNAEGIIDPTIWTMNDVTLFMYRQGVTPDQQIIQVYDCVEQMDVEFRKEILTTYPMLYDDLWTPEMVYSIVQKMMEHYSSFIWDIMPKFYNLILNGQLHLIVGLVNNLRNIPDFNEYGLELDIDLIDGSPVDIKYAILRCTPDYSGTPRYENSPQIPLLPYNPGPPLPYP